MLISLTGDKPFHTKGVQSSMGNPFMQEISVLTSAYTHTPIQTLEEGEGSLSDHVSSQNGCMTNLAQIFKAIISGLQKENISHSVACKVGCGESLFKTNKEHEIQLTAFSKIFKRFLEFYSKVHSINYCGFTFLYLFNSQFLCKMCKCRIIWM